MPYPKYKSTMIDGHEANFAFNGKIVFCRVPDVSRQYIGLGRTKAEAIASARGSMRRIPKKNWRKK